MLAYYIALGVGVLLGVGAQLALKVGSFRSVDIVNQFLNPWTLGGLFFYGLAAVFYIGAIKKIPVSIAYPTVSLGYAIVAFAGHYIWGEPLGLQQVAGLVLISGGVLLLYL